MSDEEKLSNCRFCGSEAELTRSTTTNQHQKLTIMCKLCGANVYRIVDHYGDTIENVRKFLIKLWNTEYRKKVRVTGEDGVTMVFDLKPTVDRPILLQDIFYNGRDGPVVEVSIRDLLKFAKVVEEKKL